MRIITGRFKRRKLLTSPGQTTRPITDRVKESLFEHLGGTVRDARVADVFAGTGTLGLEALSRGARSVVFIEKDRVAIDLLRRNVASLGAGDETLCWQTDATRTSFRPKNRDGLLPYDLVFLDPPYRMVSEIRPGTLLYRSLERLARPEVSSAGVLLLLRTPDEATFDLPPVWSVTRRLEYSTMTIHWLRKSDAAAAALPAEIASTGTDGTATGSDAPESVEWNG